MSLCKTRKDRVFENKPVQNPERPRREKGSGQASSDRATGREINDPNERLWMGLPGERETILTDLFKRGFHKREKQYK